MSGFKEALSALGVTIQPTAGTYNEPNNTTDLLPMSSLDNGSDATTAEDATLTGSIFGRPAQFLGRRGRAGATAALRGPGGASPPAAGAWVLGRILQAAGFTEVINAAAIQAAAAGGSTTAIQLAAAASSVDDFYKGLPIQHAAIGPAGTVRGTSIVRGYSGATKLATLCETLAAQPDASNYTIPASLAYILSSGASIPLLSAKVWRAKKAYRYRDCALNSFAINIPVANDQSQDLPSIEFAMVGVPVQSVDEAAPALPSSVLTPVPAAKAGKFVLAGLKIGHQTLRMEFTLTTGAPPNQNFDAGQEGYEIMSATRTANVDLNEQLQSTLDVDGLTDAQTVIAMLSGWGSAPGNKFIAGVPNSVLGAFSSAARNGFLGVSGALSPSDVDRSLAISCLW